MGNGSQVLLISDDQNMMKGIVDYFNQRGSETYITNQLDDVRAFMVKVHPELIFIDLHLHEELFFSAIKLTRKILPNSKIIITNEYPEIRKEILAKQNGARIFLRYPFTHTWIEKAINGLVDRQDKKIQTRIQKSTLPKVRFPMRAKITIPFLILAIVFALSSAVLVTRFVIDSFRERFLIQLVDTGKLASDWMVQEENRLLATLRLIANAEGIGESVQESDSDSLREIIFPIALNSREEIVEVLNLSGRSLLAVYKNQGEGIDYEFSQGSVELSELDFVKNVLHGNIDLHGDKYSGIGHTQNGDFFYVAGPVFSSSDTLVGAVLVGVSLKTIVNQIRQDTLAHVNLYGLNGSLYDSSLFMEEKVDHLAPDMVVEILAGQDDESKLRDFDVASATYTEILGAWEVRYGTDLGIIGTALAQNYIAQANSFTRLQIFVVVLFAVLGVVILGFYIAYQITNPLSRIIKAAIEVARGNFDVKVPSSGNDETMVLAHAFNYMVSGLQEGFIYRDLLGRTVSPEVRDALRNSFASGHLRLEGQNTVATVLMSDIRGFTTLSEKEEPTRILNWLNEYYAEVVPIIAAHGGVVDKFEGDALLTFFGILPTPLSSTESAYQACTAALEMLEVIKKINKHRQERDEPLFITGIGVNTGSLIAGGLGTKDRMNYTVIGDTVNAAQRIQSITVDFGESGVVISEKTLLELKDHRAEFRIKPLGIYNFKGKRESIWLYRLYPVDAPLNEKNEVTGERWVEAG